MTETVSNGTQQPQEQIAATPIQTNTETISTPTVGENVITPVPEINEPVSNPLPNTASNQTTTQAPNMMVPNNQSVTNPNVTEQEPIQKKTNSMIFHNVFMFLTGFSILILLITAFLFHFDSNTLVPVTCGSSYKNKGVQELLNAIVDYLPSPLDIPPIKGVDEAGNEVDRKTDDKEPFSALAFKIMTDPFVGKLCFFRVYSGTITTGSTILNATKDKKDRIGRILLMHANHRQDIEKVYAGDIAAAVGLKEVSTGDTLCDMAHPVILESMEFPEPVINIAIEPKDKANSEKMGIALAKLAEEDPTFKTWTDQETGQTIIAGMGELHLDIIVDRLKREFKVECTVGRPQVSYKETIRNKVKVQGKFIRQSGGRGQYGDVWLEMEPLEPGKGIEFESKIVGGVVPKEYVKPIEEGVREAAQNGILAGYPVIDFKATLVDGSYHEVDSSEMAFKIAASMAFKEGCKQAKSVLLEPIMRVEITVPEEYMGDVIGDVNSRRGRLEGMEAKNGSQEIRAFIPLSEMFGYATDLRSKTQGRGTYAMEPSHYEEVPKSVLETIVATRGKKSE